MRRTVKNGISGLATVLAGMVSVGILVQSCSNAVDFAWAYACGTLVSVSISWNGFGVTCSGGGTHANGEEYVTPDNLN